MTNFTPNLFNATEEEIQKARKYAAKISHSLADRAFDDDFGFAPHVTHEEKVKYSQQKRRLAEEIEAGEHDGNFTVWHQMNYFLTGE